MRVPQVVASLWMLAVNGVAAIEDGGPVTGELGNATIVENNPPGVAYKAVLPEEAFDKDAFPDGGNVKGEITAVASPDGIGIMVMVKFSNLPKEGGPFPYHLHVNQVPDDGNCTKTLAHLDPYIRGEDIACNRNLSQTCQVGDLSGKHGKIDSDPFEASYTEWYASTVDGIGAFFGNRSFVVHFGNKTRISCANFYKLEDTFSYPPEATYTTTQAGYSSTQATSTSVSTSGSTGTSTTTGKVLDVPSSTTSSPPKQSSPTQSPPTQTVVTAAAPRDISFLSGGACALAFAAAIVFAL